jgi:cytokinin dehydrogenase
MIPDEEIFYTLGLLRSATGDNLQVLEEQNDEILQFCNTAGINYKQYLPHYTSRTEWKKHFGTKWDNFLEMKLKYDPKLILSPGSSILG